MSEYDSMYLIPPVDADERLDLTGASGLLGGDQAYDRIFEDIGQNSSSAGDDKYYYQSLLHDSNMDILDPENDDESSSALESYSDSEDARTGAVSPIVGQAKRSRERRAVASTIDRSWKENWWREPPSALESAIPIWGSGREAVADIYAGNYYRAGLNAALAFSDLFLAGAATRGLIKYGIKTKGPMVWRGVPRSEWNKTGVLDLGARHYLGRVGYLKKGQDGHHWLIPNNGWGKYVPDYIKNQAWNIMPMPSKRVHNLIHGIEQPEYSIIEKYWHGTPYWFKILHGSTVTRVVDAAGDKLRSGVPTQQGDRS